MEQTIQGTSADVKATRSKGYFTPDINGGGDKMYIADNISKMIKFVIHSIFVQFG